MNYRTRHLEALRDFPLGNDYHRAGDRFIASHADAEYLTKQHRKGAFAKDASPMRPQEFLTPPPAAASPIAVAEFAVPEVQTPPSASEPAAKAQDPAPVAPAKRAYVRRTPAAEK